MMSAQECAVSAMRFVAASRGWKFFAQGLSMKVWRSLAVLKGIDAKVKQ